MTMDFQDYANLGSAILTGDEGYVGAIDREALHARNHSDELRQLLAYALASPENLRVHIDGPIVGWTTPALTYDKQRQINGSALSLNFDIEANVKSQKFKDSWNQWFKSWQTFFDRYQTMGGKAGALLDTDLVAAQTESFRIQLVGDPKRDLEGWIGAYEREPGVPPSTAHAVPKVSPLPPGKKDEDEDPTPTPWWLIALFAAGGVGLVAGSFFIIRRKVLQGKEAEHFIKRDVLPIVLGSYMGPTGVALAHSATNRFSPAGDPSGMGGPTFIGPERV
jgi:hypothetical protein